MKRAVFATPLVLFLGLAASAPALAGPTAGHGPWTFCPNESIVCADQLGPDVDTSNDWFDCMTKNGRLGYALQSSTTGTVRCWGS